MFGPLRYPPGNSRRKPGEISGVKPDAKPPRPVPERAGSPPRLSAFSILDALCLSWNGVSTIGQQSEIEIHGRKSGLDRSRWRVRRAQAGGFRPDEALISGRWARIRRRRTCRCRWPRLTFRARQLARAIDIRAFDAQGGSTPAAIEKGVAICMAPKRAKTAFAQGGHQGRRFPFACPT